MSDYGDYSDDFEESQSYADTEPPRGSAAAKGKAKPIPSRLGPPPQARDQRLQNQINQLRKANDKLRREIAENENADRIIELKNLVIEKEIDIKKLQAENKSLMKIQRDQSKELERLSNEDEIPREIRRYTEEVRALREQVRKYQERHRRDDETMKGQHEKLMKLSDKCKKLMEQLKANNIDPQEQMDIAKVKAELTKRQETVSNLERQVAILQKAKEADAKKYRNQIHDTQKRATQLNGQISTLKDQLDAKDKEVRKQAIDIKKKQQEAQQAKKTQPAVSAGRKKSPTPEPAPAAKSSKSSRASSKRTTPAASPSPQPAKSPSPAPAKSPSPAPIDDAKSDSDRDSIASSPRENGFASPEPVTTDMETANEDIKTDISAPNSRASSAKKTQPRVESRTSNANPAEASTTAYEDDFESFDESGAVTLPDAADEAPAAAQESTAIEDNVDALSLSGSEPDSQHAADDGGSTERVAVADPEPAAAAEPEPVAEPEPEPEPEAPVNPNKPAFAQRRKKKKW